MIKIVIVTDRDKVLDSSEIKETNLTEVSVVVYRLEQVIQQLLNRKFEGIEFKK